MNVNEWKALKRGDRIRYTGTAKPRHFLRVVEVYINPEGERFLTEGKWLFPMEQFSNDDYEKVEKN